MRTGLAKVRVDRELAPGHPEVRQPPPHAASVAASVGSLEHGVLGLQRSVGNRAAVAILSGAPSGPIVQRRFLDSDNPAAQWRSATKSVNKSRRGKKQTNVLEVDRLLGAWGTRGDSASLRELKQLLTGWLATYKGSRKGAAKTLLEEVNARLRQQETPPQPTPGPTPTVGGQRTRQRRARQPTPQQQTNQQQQTNRQPLQQTPVTGGGTTDLEDFDEVPGTTPTTGQPETTQNVTTQPATLAERLVAALAKGVEELRNVAFQVPESQVHPLARDPQLDTLAAAMSAQEFAVVAAAISVRAEHAPAARRACLDIIEAQLQDKDVALRMAKAIQVVVVPRDRQMTALAEFASLLRSPGKNGVPGTTFDGRYWAHVRGTGFVSVGTNNYTAVAEENLLGGDADPAVFEAVGNVPKGAVEKGYEVGYSTTTHEYAHSIHQYGLSRTDIATIKQLYDDRLRASLAAPKTDMWVDGALLAPTVPTSWGWTQEQYEQGMLTLEASTYRNYSCQNEFEFFAQLSNAYMGTNTGKDPGTQQTRHNGKAWIRAHEAGIMPLLDRIYGGKTINELDPMGSVTGVHTNPLVPSRNPPLSGPVNQPVNVTV